MGNYLADYLNGLSGSEAVEVISALQLAAGIGSTTSTLITVGAGGNYSTLNAALLAAKKLRPGYLSKGVMVEIRLLSGFVMAEQVFVVQEDLSYVTITSVDAEVPVLRSAINQNNGSSANNWRTGTYPLICSMRGGAHPFLNVTFAFDNSGTGRGTVGVYQFEGGRGVIALNRGVKNAGWRGLLPPTLQHKLCFI